MHMALAEALETAAASSFGSYDAKIMGYRHPYNGSSASAYYDAAASAFPAVAFGAGVRPAGPPPAQLDVFDYMADEGGVHPAPAPAVPALGTPPPPPRRIPVEQVVPDGAGYGHAASSSSSVSRSAAAAEGPTTARADRIAFRMKSDEEVIDDGYKWRKYGKKSVKNSPNPRNYYRCSSEGCNVKKRVERDRDDPSYVVTMYEGVHNHVSPGTVYYATQDAASGRFFVSGMHHQPGP